MNTAAKQIVNLRKKMGLTQEGFAEKIGFSRSYIKDIESGRANPSSNILKSISLKFNVSIDFILFGGSMRERANSFMALLHKCLIEDSQETTIEKKKIYDHLQGIINITEYEISFYIYKLLTLYGEREIETKTLELCSIENYIIETPSAYHAFLGAPVSKDHFAENVIAYSIITSHSVWHRISFPACDRSDVDSILRIKSNKFFYAPLNKFYEPHELFENTREEIMRPGTNWAHESRWQRKESIEKYFSEIDRTQTITDANVGLRLSDVEQSMINIFRAIDRNSLKDFYILLASKGSRLAKKKKDKLKKDIALLNKFAK